jgi:hypothetical protein
MTPIIQHGKMALVEVDLQEVTLAHMRQPFQAEVVAMLLFTTLRQTEALVPVTTSFGLCLLAI